MPEFVPGLDLARAFYEEVVASLVGSTAHSAALLGYGSEILGFDTARSTDHGWGPRLQLFVRRDDVEPVRRSVEEGLPDEFRGWPTRFGWDEQPVIERVFVSTLDDWLEDHLGFDPRQGVSTASWLSTPQQILLGVTRGAVFHDGLGELEGVRESLAWYPDDIWLWLLSVPVEADRPGGAVHRAYGRGRRRARFAHPRGSPRTGRRPHVLSPGAALCAVLEVARLGVSRARRAGGTRAAAGRAPRGA